MTKTPSSDRDVTSFGLRRGVAVTIIIILAAISFLAFNVLSNTALRSARIDLTEDRLFTLSEGTKNILRSIDEPVTLKFFYSESIGTAIPQIHTYATRVRDLLREYDAIAGDKLQLDIIDP